MTVEETKRLTSDAEANFDLDILEVNASIKRAASNGRRKVIVSALSILRKEKLVEKLVCNGFTITTTSDLVFEVKW
jgi:hypothetical protein